MIDAAYVQRMARYNRWQNQSLYSAADTLTDDARRQDRGAFFGSIHKTLNHILWGDRAWMSRFSPSVAGPGVGIPGSTMLVDSWAELKVAREAMDATMIGWADALQPSALAGELKWRSAILNRDLTVPLWVLVTHVFNHGTHHRGQVHAMLTQAGAKPDDTDLFLMPE